MNIWRYCTALGCAGMAGNCATAQAQRRKSKSVFTAATGPAAGGRCRARWAQGRDRHDQWARRIRLQDQRLRRCAVQPDIAISSDAPDRTEKLDLILGVLQRPLRADGATGRRQEDDVGHHLRRLQRGQRQKAPFLRVQVHSTSTAKPRKFLKDAKPSWAGSEGPRLPSFVRTDLRRGNRIDNDTNARHPGRDEGRLLRHSAGSISLITAAPRAHVILHTGCNRTSRCSGGRRASRAEIVG